jgi:hypothetical protein
MTDATPAAQQSGNGPTPDQTVHAAAVNEPTNHAKADGRIANWFGFGFYAWVSSLALVGSVIASGNWLHWDALFRIPICVALELGSIALAARADYRRIKGEKAYGYLALSALFAAVAIAVNLFGHEYVIAGVVFAGLSGSAYVIWLLNSGDRRRDAARLRGDMDEITPSYGILRRLRHPILTTEAKALAQADATLGLHGSIALARQNRQDARAAALQHRRDEQADVAIEAWLRTYYTTRLGEETAALLVVTLPLRAMARYIRENADAQALAQLVLDQLDVDRVATIVAVADRASRSGQRALPAGPARASHEATKLRAVAATSRPSQATIRAAVGSGHPTSDPTSPGDHSALAVQDAATIRATYPDGLPDRGAQRLLRSAPPEGLGWHADKASRALRAYLAGADLTTSVPAGGAAESSGPAATRSGTATDAATG